MAFGANAQEVRNPPPPDSALHPSLLSVTPRDIEVMKNRTDASKPYSDTRVVQGGISDEMAKDYTFEMVKKSIDKPFGLTLHRKAYEKFKSPIDSLGQDYEVIPRADSYGGVHVRRKPAVW